MLKKIIITTLFLFGCVTLKAQDAYFNLFRQNNMWLNPASVGEEDKHIFSLSGRTQWSTYNSLLLTYDQPLKKINSGIGGTAWYEDDGTGHLRTYYASLSYDYQIKLTDKMKIGLGLEGAFVRRTIEVQDLLFGSQFIGTGFTNSTVLTPAILSAHNYFDLNAGLWYKWSDFYAGVSVKHITQPDFTLGDVPDKFYINYIVTAGYTLKFNKHFSMIPSVQCETEGPDNLLEVNDEFSFNNTYFLGGGFLSTNLVNPLIVCGGINWKDKYQLMVSYSFIRPVINELIPPGWTAYEANLKYRF